MLYALNSVLVLTSEYINLHTGTFVYHYTEHLYIIQLSLFRKLPARLLSRAWGELATKELPKLCRQPVLGLYAWAFGCNMEEALIEDIREYPSLSKLFVRQLKENARTVSSEYAVVSSCVVLQQVHMLYFTPDNQRH